MSSLPANFYDGQTSRRHSVTLTLGESGVLQLHGDGIEREYPVQAITKSNRLGKVVRLIDFNDGGRLELDASSELDRFFDHYRVGHTEGLIHRLEHSLKYIAVAVVVTLLSAGAFVVYGIPIVAERIAYALPVEAQTQLGEGVLESLDSYVFETSQVDAQHQAALQQWFATLTQGLDEGERLQLVFRNSELMGANAMALPSGTIVVTDGLVQLAHNDEEIAAVLAHEIGHIEYRHSLRGAIQSSGVAVVIALMLGDITTASNFAVALPSLMVNMKYSRNFETEADNYARVLMRQHQIPLHYFADILTRLGESHDAGDKETSFFDSHPAVMERVQQFRD